MPTRLPVIQSERQGSLNRDGSRRFVHPADVKGRFTTRRYVTFAVLLVIYVALPFIEIGGHPAVFLDIPARRFYLFGTTWNAQDFWLVFFLVTGLGFALFFLTMLLGRVWCGYACPQTVFLEGIYRRIERWVEGPRNERLRRNRGPATWDKAWRKALKHALFVLVSLLLAHVFLSYFVSLPALLDMVQRPPREHPEAFAWMAGTGLLLYGNFAWFREQLCLIVCPYGRLQSVLTDDDTVFIGYDRVRGEPRGKKSDPTAGDCVGCNRCVVVCPTGIDIREGLQLECIGCAACVDACDEIMGKVGRAPGLVRYASMNELDGRPRRVLRPRLGVYVFFGLVGLAAATFAFSKHAPYEANLLRLPGPPYVVDSGNVRNGFELHVVNKHEDDANFTVAFVGEGLDVVVATPTFTLPSMGETRVPVFVSMPADRATERPVTLRVEVDGSPDEARELVGTFVAPGS